MKLLRSGLESRLYLRSYGFLMAIILLVIGCSPGPELVPDSPSPAPSLIPIQSQPSLEVVYPLPSTELIGGQELRVTLIITYEDREGVEGATTQVDLLSPDGSLYTTQLGIDQGEGRYLTDAVNLPLRNAVGTWTVRASAVLDNGQISQTTGTFSSIQSFSEGLEELYGFWIALPTPPFAYTGPSFADPKLKFHPYQDGGGYVILTNLPISGPVAEFSMLDIHWRPSHFPADQGAAQAYIQNLAGPHGMTVSYTDLEAAESSFLDESAWLVSGRWVELLNSNHRPDPISYPVKWIIFNCPESNFSWTLMITSQKSLNMPELRDILETFQCPVSY